MLSVRDAYSEEDGFGRMISSDFEGSGSNPAPDYTANHPIPSNGFTSGPSSMEMVCVKDEEIDNTAVSILGDVYSPAVPNTEPETAKPVKPTAETDDVKFDPLQTITTTTTTTTASKTSASTTKPTITSNTTTMSSTKIKPEPAPGSLEEWIRCFRDHILKLVVKHTKSLPFRKPVDAVALGIYPIYNQVITRPMDLGTIRRKIDRGKYTSKQQCIDDLMLVWMNALTFNPPMHYVYNAALEFKQLTSDLLERLEREGVEAFVQGLKKPRKSSGSRSGGASRKEPRERKISSSLYKYERQTNRPPLRNQYQQQQQPFYRTTSPPNLPVSTRPENSLDACDSLLRSLLNLRQHCDFVQPFMHIDAETRYNGEVPLSLTRIERKLRTNQYRDHTEFAADMRQMFTETYKYNNPDSPMVTAAGKLQKEFELRFAKINFDERKTVRPPPTSLSEEEQFAAKLRSAQNFMRKIEAELKELIRDYHRMKNRRKRKIAQQVKNGVAETGAQINAACIAVVDAFASNDENSDAGVTSGPVSHHSYENDSSHRSMPTNTSMMSQYQLTSHNTSQQNPMTSHQPMMSHAQQNSNLSHSMTQGYHHPAKKPRLDQPPVLTLQEANDLKEQIGQLHPDQQLQILEILQNNGEQLYPDEHGEVEIELAKCCLGSVKEVRAFLQNLKAQVKLNDEATVSSTGDPQTGLGAPMSGSGKKVDKDRSSSSDSSSDDGSSSDSSDSSSESD